MCKVAALVHFWHFIAANSPLAPVGSCPSAILTGGGDLSSKGGMLEVATPRLLSRRNQPGPRLLPRDRREPSCRAVATKPNPSRCSAPRFDVITRTLLRNVV